METQAEGMVAIVQSHQDAGLTVTVMGDRQGKNCDVGEKSLQVLTKIPAGTSTGFVLADAGSQGCDGRYASSYKMSHCSTVPTSPPVESPEFPPQRAELCPSLHPYSQPSKGTETFVHSLRKYPSLSPKKSIPSDLVQRLLTYTQAKNFSKSSYHTKSIRSIRNKNIESKETSQKTKLNTGVQTYTRAKRRKEDTSVPLRLKDKDINSRSPINEARSIRHFDDHVNATYNYLKSVYPRNYCVCYLTEMTRCLRDTLREICEDRSVPCPNMEYRYSQHRRQHHHDGTAQDQQACSSYTEICCYCRKPVPCPCRAMGSPDDFEIELDQAVKDWLLNIPVYPNENESDKYERDEIVKILIDNLKKLKGDDFLDKAKAEITECVSNMPMWSPGNDNDLNIFKEQIVDELLNKLRNINNANSKSDHFEDVIKKYVEDLNLKKTNSREEIDKNTITKRLMTKLKPLVLNPPVDKEDLKTALKYEIIDFLGKLPINTFGDRKILNKIADNIAKELMNILARDISELQRDNHDTNIQNKITDDEIHNIITSDDLDLELDKFRDEITNFVESLDFKSIDSHGKIVHEKDVSENFMNKLIPLVLNPPAEKEGLKKAFKDTIFKAFEKIPIKINGDIRERISILADNLANQFKNLPFKDNSEPQTHSKNQEFKEHNISNKSTDSNDETHNYCEKADYGEVNVDNFKSKSLEGYVEGNSKNILRDSPNKSKMNENEVLTNFKDDNLENKTSEISKLPTHSNSGRRLVDISDTKLNGIGPNRNKITTALNTLSNIKDSRNEIKHVIIDALKDLPVKLNDDGTKILNEFADNLANQLQDKMSKDISKWSTNLFSSRKIEDLNYKNTNDGSTEISNGIPGSATRNFVFNKEAAKNVFKKQVNTLKQLPSKINGDKCETEAKIVDNIGNQRQSRTTENASNYNTGKRFHNPDLKLSNERRKLKYSGPVEKDKSESLALNNNLKKTSKEDAIDATIPLPFQQRKQWSDKKSSHKFTNSLKDKVSYILDKSNFEFDNRDEIESILTDILADQEMRGEDNQTKNRLVSTLERMSLSHEQSEYLASKLLNVGKEMSLISKPEDSYLLIARKLKPSSKTKESAVDPQHTMIINSNEDTSTDTSTDSKKHMKATVKILAERIREIVSERSIAPDGKQEWIEDEIIKFLEILPDTPIAKIKLIDERLQNGRFKTSTPKRTSIKEAVSFKPKGDSKYSTISPIAMSQLSHISSQEEGKYLHQLMKAIDTWMSNLPLHFNNDEEKQFKDIMTTDLANDIVDRQKYLQLNPHAKTSDEKDLEHLKYQIFRWLKKLPSMQNVLPQAANIVDLMKHIKSISVPILTKSKRSDNTQELSKQSSKGSESYAVTLKDASLLNVIWKWFESIPPKYKSSTLVNNQRQNVKALAEQINHLNTDDTSTETDFDDMVSLWLRKMLKDTNVKYITSLLEGLKAVLVNKEFIPRNIKLYNRPHNSASQPSQHEKTIEHLNEENADFVPIIKTALANKDPDNIKDIKKKLEEGIQTFLNESPLQKNENTYVHELSMYLNELIEILQTYAKSTTVPSTSMTSKSGTKADVENTFVTPVNISTQYMSNATSKATCANDNLSVKFQNIPIECTSLIPGSKALHQLYKNIEKWCQNLPVQKGSNDEENIKAIKENIATKLVKFITDLNIKPETFYDDTIYEKQLSNEVDNLLTIVPSSSELKNNKLALKQDLIAMIKKAKQDIENEQAKEVHKKQIHDAISQTFNRPSLEITSEEQVCLEILIDQLADAYIELNYAAESNEIKDKLKNKIRDKIIEFSNDYLSRHPNSSIDPKKLNIELFDMLQKIPNPKEEIIQSEVELIKIKDIINDWLKELPLKENGTPSKKLEQKKLINVLAKNLHDMEKGKEVDTEINAEDRKTIEIRNCIKKLQSKSGGEENIDEIVEKLLRKLKDSEESRRHSVSKIRQNLNNRLLCTCAGFIEKRVDNECICHKNYNPGPSNRYLSQSAPPLPPSTLNTEDRAHLHRIRDRKTHKKKPSFKPRPCKDSSVNPIPLDAGSQTDVRPWNMPPPYPAPKPVSTPQYPKQPLTPRVLVKEFIWDDSGQRDASFVPSADCGHSQSRNPNPISESYPNQTNRFVTPQQNSTPRHTFDQNLERSQQSLKSTVQPQTLKHTSSTFMPSPFLSLSPPTTSSKKQSCMQTPLGPPVTSCRQSDQPVASPTSVQKSGIQTPLASLTTPYPSITQPEEPMISERLSNTMFPSIEQSQTSPLTNTMPPGQSQKVPRVGEEIPGSQSPINRLSYTIPPCMMSGHARKPPCNDHTRSPCNNPQNQTPQHRKSRPPRFCSSSSYDTEVPQPESSGFQLRLTRLGSFDGPSKVFKRQPAKRSYSPKDYEWCMNFPDEKDVWGTACARRRVYQPSGAFVKEKDRCCCRERVLNKYPPNKPSSHEDDITKRCFNCVSHCPHPSHFFFR